MTIALKNIRIVRNVTPETVPSASLFEERGELVEPGLFPWNLEEYTGPAGEGSAPVLLRMDFEIPVTGKYRIGAGADWWVHVWIDEKMVMNAAGDTPPSAENNLATVNLSAGKHHLDALLIRGNATASLALEIQKTDLEDGVDFSRKTGMIRKELHGSSVTLSLSGRGLDKFDEALRRMNFSYSRTHDWALVNSGQRIIDTHFIFPLMHLDPADPKNYFFKATDEIIRLTQEEMGMKVFYRMGTSIEHSGEVHFNALPPEDPEKYAEVLAGIIRHYTQGWTDGFHYDIRYWEIWNEPEGSQTMWIGSYQETFIPFFVTVLKHLKAEFPDLQFGGPAMMSATMSKFEPLMDACKKAEIAPDFISWHSYSDNPHYLIRQPAAVRKWLDERGFTKTKLCINEWHYLNTWKGCQSSSSPEEYRTAMNELQGINAGVYNLSVLSGWQDSPLDLAMWYGIGWKNPPWGCLDAYKNPTKNYWSMVMFGQFIRDYSVKCFSNSLYDFNLHLLSGCSEDGSKAGIIAADYKGTGTEVRIPLKGAGMYRKISALILDETRNMEPVPVEIQEHDLVLKKACPGSAAFLVMFEK